MIRLNKYLAECGVGSRRKCDQFILEGKVSVNGSIENRLGVKIDENTDSVKFADNLLKKVNRFEYILLNKPKGYVTTAADEKGRKTVLDLVNSKMRLFPVGRLDIDTNGLLLLTNDGDLTYKLTHPKFEVDKIYDVKLDRDLKLTDKKQLESGIDLEEGKTSKCTIQFQNPQDKTRVKMTLHQGWKRQVRRMFDELDYKVLMLRRISLAFLNLQGLRSGASRSLTVKEIEHLKRVC
ncbi:MAG: rRNA pseudouridine synthase [Caldithrix sp.]|nr:MAG: rRNA pseudouridine synthase [Caldithrix sp.]